MLIFVAALGLAAATASAHADGVSVPPSLNAVRITGELGDEVWQRTTAVDAFVQREPHDGGEPSQRTEFRVAYDATTLFVKVRAYDTQPDQIVTYLTRRDLDSPCDWIRVYVDSYHDKRSGFYFGVNAAGTQYDGTLYNDDWDDNTWDGVWEGKVTRDAEGWIAELRIPYSQLRFVKSSQYIWGINFRRDIARKNEFDYIVYTPQIDEIGRAHV